MSNESTILLLKSKLHALVNGFNIAVKKGDREEINKFKQNYRITKKRLDDLLSK